MLEQILNEAKIDDSIKSQLTEAIEKSINIKALELAEAKSEEYTTLVDDFMSEKTEALTQMLEKYLDKVVDDFVDTNLETMQESADKQNYKAVLDGFGAVLETAGVEFMDIADTKKRVDESGDLHDTVASLESKIDSLVSENLELEDKANKYLVTGLKRQITEGMSDMKKERFERLSGFVKFNPNEPQTFIDALDDIAESLSEDVPREIKRVKEVRETKIVKENTQASKDDIMMGRHLW